MTKTTLKDIALHAGVSITTVSRVLNGQASEFRIKKATEDAIIKSANELGFTPYKSIYKPMLIRSKTIGLIIPDISHFFLGNLARTISQEAQKSGYSVIISDSGENTESERKAIELFIAHNVDGIIVLPVGKESGHLQEYYNQGVNLVVCDRIFPDLHCPSVGVNNYNGSVEAVTYLIENGHKRIACLQRLPHSWINNERLRAFMDTHEKYGIPVDESLIIGETFGQKNGYLEARLLFSGRIKLPTAIFALSHLLALGVLQVIREEGLSIPEDISLVGFDDLPFTEYFNKPISTVNQPVVEMGLLAVNLLLEQIRSKDRKPPVQIMLPATLVRRNSVKRLPV